MQDKSSTYFVHESAIVYESDIGDYARVGRANYLYQVALGRRSYTGQNTTILRAELGSFTSISWNVTIGGGEHDYRLLTQHSFLYDHHNSDLRPQSQPAAYDRLSANVNIGHDVWIGSNSVIRRGVQIGSGAVIGALSFVNSDVNPYEIWAGSPARKIGQRFTDEQIDMLMKIQWWSLTDLQIKSLFSDLSSKPTSFSLRQLIEKIESMREK